MALAIGLEGLDFSPERGHMPDEPIYGDLKLDLTVGQSLLCYFSFVLFLICWF